MTATLSTPTGERNRTMDILKGLGILSVVVGHTGVFFTNFLYLFHMAVFFMVSGWFFAPRRVETLSGLGCFLWKKLRALWLPYAAWNTIFSLLHNMFLRWNIYSADPRFAESGAANVLTVPWTPSAIATNILQGFVFGGGTQMGGTLWFLKTMFEVTVLFAFVTFLSGGLRGGKYTVPIQLALSMLLLVVGWQCSCRGMSLRFWERSCSAYWLMTAGMLLRRLEEPWNRLPGVFRFTLWMVSLIVLLGMNRLGQVALVSNRLVNSGFYLTSSLAGFVFLREAAAFLDRWKPIGTSLAALGRESLAIMVLHFLSYKLVSLLVLRTERLPTYALATFPTLHENTAWSILYILVGVAVPFLLAKLWRLLWRSIRIYQ